jgi:hypothetical protein
MKSGHAERNQLHREYDHKFGRSKIGNFFMFLEGEKKEKEEKKGRERREEREERREEREEKKRERRKGRKKTRASYPGFI